MGLFFGKIFFQNYEANGITVFDEKDKVYMLQVGVYSTLDKMEEAVSRISKIPIYLSR